MSLECAAGFEAAAIGEYAIYDAFLREEGIDPTTYSRVKLDIDGRLPADMFDKIQWALSTLKIRVNWCSIFRTERGWHVEIDLRRRLHPWRIVALQAILGSDYRRELFNLRRTGNWRSLPPIARERWNVLFRRKFTLTKTKPKQESKDARN